MIKQAVIIAAGAGSRLNGHSHLPKPLVPVAGVGLLKRTILTAGRAGIDRFVIVTGHRSDEIRQAIDRDSQITAEVQWVFNPDWERGNGLSVLAARPHLGGESFVLSMSDHLFDPGVFVVMQNTTLGNGECALGVDYRVDDVFDLDDATKVRVDSGKIEAIGKTMTEFNAIDAGVFSCSPALFGVLEAAVERGQDSLSAGIQQLAADGRMRTTDIGDLFWSDVDTPEAHAHAGRGALRAIVRAVYAGRGWLQLCVFPPGRSSLVDFTSVMPFWLPVTFSWLISQPFLTVSVAWVKNPAVVKYQETRLFLAGSHITMESPPYWPLLTEWVMRTALPFRARSQRAMS